MEDRTPRAAGSRPDPPLCSILVVGFNGRRRLAECLSALLAMDYPADRLELILIDNGSQDGSVEFVRQTYPAVRVLRNSENNYCKALNLGIGAARGEWIGMVNQDAVVDPQWLPELLRVLQQNEGAGGAGGKILLPNGRLHSAGLVETADGDWQDRGGGEKDAGQFGKIEAVSGVRGAGALYRRSALEAVGPLDEDFVIYWEDVDLSYRLRRQGWAVMYTPHARLYHEFQGDKKTNRVAYYFRSRNRLLVLAKHRPEQLPDGLKTAEVYRDQAYDMLLEFLPGVLHKLLATQRTEVVQAVLPRLVAELSGLFEAHKIENLLARLEVVLGYRPLKIGIYDHALHFVGGGQKYVCTMASVLQDRYDVTYIANKPVTLEALSQWYDLDLSKCRLKIIPLPFYEARGSEVIHASMVMGEMENPFLAISEESVHYDIFVNANMLSKCLPLSNRSVLVCHFPDVNPGPYFAAHKYTHVLTNGQYTTRWLEKRWGMRAHRILYPPVNMYGPGGHGVDPLAAKENVILSVARFEERGTKKQKEMVQAFNRLCEHHPDLMRTWRLWLVGGAVPGVSYVDEVRRLAKSNRRIVVKVNVPLRELRQLYARARIFWHACGLGVDEEQEPELIEHFGMTTVEAMQNHCAPVVINGGGQREIVEHGQSGFLFNSLAELCEYTQRLIADPDLLQRIMREAYARSHRFDQARFAREVRAFFEELERAYVALENPRIEYVRSAY